MWKNKQWTSAVQSLSSAPDSRQHLERLGVQRLPIGRAILTTVDAPSDRVELARIGQSIQASARPEPRSGHTGVLRLLQQLRVID